MSFIDRLVGNDRSKLIEIAYDFRDVTAQQREIIIRQEAEILRLKLEYARWARGVVENFLVFTESPEMEIRDILISAIRDFDDEVARLEEHVS